MLSVSRLAQETMVQLLLTRSYRSTAAGDEDLRIGTAQCLSQNLRVPAVMEQSFKGLMRTRTHYLGKQSTCWRH